MVIRAALSNRRSYRIFILPLCLVMLSATPLLLAEWFIPSGRSALHFEGTFMTSIGECHSFVYTPGSTNSVLNLLAIYAINCGTLNL